MNKKANRDALARFEGVQKTYDGETLVVKALDLDINRGEFLTLLGPSGSGKTTTLMMLAGFETPTSGRILLDGRDLARLPPHKRDIGMVFQNYALFPHMSVEENIAFPLSVRGAPKAETTERVRRALDMVRLEGFGGRRPAQLSGGQQQRIALARALVFEPKLVLMDEPLGALDKQLREEMQLEIRHIHERLGITIVYVTHDQGEALTMSDRIAVFHRGVVQQLDGPKALYERPCNAYVARFIGESNQLGGRIETAENGRCIVRLDNGARIAACPVDARTAGERTVVSLRPERMELRPAAADPCPPGINRLPASVREVIYLGDHMRVRVDLGGESECMVRLSATGDGPELQPGAQVAAIWRAEDGLAFAPENP
jgi:putative spermidine/putrescine transport system ATP-binding protein